MYAFIVAGKCDDGVCLESRSGINGWQSIFSRLEFKFCQTGMPSNHETINKNSASKVSAKGFVAIMVYTWLLLLDP
ncbi:hypothetical protein J7E71_07720 [Mesobacillus foraminis]|uniref:hypothetical protein n=1 Tax=Mesobacillus foraminis TaxID=279826 RepID=UPI001BEC0E79|nr:hypothetical protein [Mesobacillus foraminis]MBT2755833.1 hypothetical protein [Mesobacillus foraminis]